MQAECPTVRWLCVYPIKGLHGISVDSARVLASGALEFDRRWAILDARGRYVNGKNRVEVHSIQPHYDLARLEVTLDGKTYSLERDGSTIAKSFADRLGEPVEWQENVGTGFPDDTDSPGPTFVSTGSLARVGEWFGFSLEEARRRFRANVEFDGVEAFWEDRLYGSWFRIGDVEVIAVNPCQRCAVPSRDSRTGEHNPGFQKRFAELRQAEIPSFARTAQFNHYYRLTVNTRIDATHVGKTIRLGDRLTFD
jgi:uncharacterized protein